MQNVELVDAVSDELYWDPRIDSDAVAVSAAEGVVTLRGTVGSLREKREAENDAKRVFGVELVENELEVKLMDRFEREDADLRGDILQALALDSVVPDTIDVTVEDGFVTLTGTADWQYQRDEAEFVASNIVGTVQVINEVQLKPKPTPGEVRDSIRGAFQRNAGLDADLLTITTVGGTVTLSGKVHSWAEHDQAMDAAWSAPGVLEVEDHITVTY
ncbi:MAG TPA: BON domain-containing protein [Thermoleophilia bacterium]|nr:BON domain-containing protein [Thermoleophilia bacterium]